MTKSTQTLTQSGMLAVLLQRQRYRIFQLARRSAHRKRVHAAFWNTLAWARRALTAPKPVDGPMKKRGVVYQCVLVSLLLTAGGFARSAQAAPCEGAWAFGRIPFSGTHWGWYILFNYCEPSGPGQNCGTYSTVLFAGQSVIVANVVLAIFHDPDEPNFSLGNSLHVRINPIVGYLLEDVRMWVSTSPVPKNPSPGKFPYQLDPNELGNFDALIPLTDIAPPNTQLYVAIHAEACSGLP